MSLIEGVLSRKLLQFALVLGIMSACSHVGAPKPILNPGDGLVDFRLCVLTNLESINEPDDLDFLGAIQEEFKPYEISVIVPWVKHWEPDSASNSAIEGLSKLHLPSDCDRLLAIVAPTPVDFIGGLFGIEVLGAVDKRTHTRGFIRGEKVSLNQVFFPPSQVAIHETYHLFGCNDGFDDDGCLQTLTHLREIAKKRQALKNSFFPAVGKDGARVIHTRGEVDLLQRSSIYLK